MSASCCCREGGGRIRRIRGNRSPGQRFGGRRFAPLQTGPAARRQLHLSRKNASKARYPAPHRKKTAARRYHCLTALACSHSSRYKLFEHTECSPTAAVSMLSRFSATGQGSVVI